MFAFKTSCAAVLLAAGLCAPTFAQNTDASDCYTQWKSADADRNGVLDKGENAGAGIAQGTTRDVFLAGCLKGANVSEPPGKPSQAGVKDDFPKDLGKGDLTQGKNRFTQAEAKKRLESLGYRDIQDLTLDGNGVWRATAMSSGERASVGLDSQGDVVSN